MPVTRHSGFFAMKNRTFIAIWLGFGLLYFWGAPANDYNVHVWQAWAWLHGHLYADGMPLVAEHVVIKGHQYLLHPPVPAIICVPFVAIFGPTFPEHYLAAPIAAFDVALIWRMTRLEQFMGSPRWLTAFFGLGTVIAYEAVLGASWGFCLIIGCGLTILALTEALDEGRAHWVGIWAALAALARYDLVLLWPLYAVMLWRKRKLTFEIAWPLAAAAVSYLAYNMARFGGLTDPTMFMWYAIEPYGQVAHPGAGAFSIHHLPVNVFTAVFLGPAFQFKFPWLRPQAWGQSLMTTSPALVMALKPSLGTVETLLMWAGVILSMSACMLVWNNGWSQFGARYWILALPFLVALLAMSETDQMMRILIVASVLFTISGTLIVAYYGLIH